MSAEASTPRNGFRELARAHAREVVRDRRAVLAILMGFLALIGLLGGIDLVVTGSTGQPPGLLQSSLGLVGITGSLAVALVVTTVPLVGYRRRGVLRQLSTTPASRTTFLLAHVLVRAGIVLAETALIATLAFIGGLDGPRTVLLTFTLVLGATMLLAFGYVLAARMADPDVALHLAYIVPLLVLVTSGALFPLDVYPEPVRSAMSILPTTWLVDAIDAQIGGGEPGLPLAASWALMSLTTAVACYAAARLFRWGAPD